MLSALEKPPRINPTKRQKRRERLTSGEKRRFRRVVGKKCEITGESLRPGDIHHIRPVQSGGRKTYDNLALLKPEVHRALHSLVRLICKNDPSLDIGEVTLKLSKDAIALGKLQRVIDGEDPELVYKRELYIEHVRSQQDMFEG